MHVVDAPRRRPEGQIDAVRAVLAEIGAADVPELLVFNKADLAPERRARARRSDHAGSVAVSAVTGEGIDEFLRTLGDRLRALTKSSSCSIPYDRGDVLAAVHREGEVVSTCDEPTACGVRARLADASAGRLPSSSSPREPTGRRRRRAGCDRWLTAGFVPPPYPYDRLDGSQPIAGRLDGGVVDLSIGTPCDPPPPA